MDEWCFDKLSREGLYTIDIGAERDDSAWQGEAKSEGEGAGEKEAVGITGRRADGQMGNGAAGRRVTHRTGAREAMGTSGIGGIVRSPMYAQGGSMWAMSTQRRQYINPSPVIL